MKVRGVAFLARQDLAVAEHGEVAWRGFLADVARTEPTFASPVMPVSQLELEPFLRLNEAFVKRFYPKDPRAFWTLGISSARSALTRGQLRGMFDPGDYKRFLHFTPAIWKGYFNEGRLETHPLPDGAELHLEGVPRPHVYFEHSVMGFAEGGLRQLGAKELSVECLRGFGRGDADVQYRFRVLA